MTSVEVLRKNTVIENFLLSAWNKQSDNVGFCIN
jgi:hypothetical protein